MLPVFNAEKTLKACLHSVQRQSDGAFECIIIDDGSTDGSVEIAAAFAQTDERFVLTRGRHRGLIDSLNVGIAAATRPLIARMDADDLMRRDRLSLQRRALDTDTSLAAVGCRVRLFPRASMKAGLRSYEHWLNSIESHEDLLRERYIECPIAHPTLMIRRTVLETIRYRDQGWPEDYDLVLRLLSGGHTARVIPRRLLAWRNEPTRLSRTDSRYADAQFTKCKATFLSQDILREADKYVLWGYGGTGRALAAALWDLGKRPEAIVDLHPGRLGNRIRGAPVVPPSWLAHRTNHVIVVSVAHAGPREQIREALRSYGYVETIDFICAA